MASDKTAFEPPQRRVSNSFLDAGGAGKPVAKAFKQRATGWSAKQQAQRQMAHDFHEAYQAVVTDKAFLGAQPKMLKQPLLVTPTEETKNTTVVVKTVQELIRTSSRVLVILGGDAIDNKVWQDVLKGASEEPFTETTPAAVALADSWLHTIPRLEKISTDEAPWRALVGKSLFIYIGTPGRYLHMCTRSKLTAEFDSAYANNRLVVICRGGSILPIGHQVENVYGIDSMKAVEAVANSLKWKDKVLWGHGPGTKKATLSLAFPGVPGFEAPSPPPALPPIPTLDSCGDTVSFDFFVEYVRYLNQAKLACPNVPIANYYDTGMLVSVCMGSICEAGLSLLTDHDGLCMLRDASIGHTISKLNQLVEVEPMRSTRSVYNVFIGDGAARLNNGVETTMHLIEGYSAEPLVTVFIFNNSIWAIEDNLVAHAMDQHTLKNLDFYDLIGEHGNVCICENIEELSITLQYLSEQTNAYLRGEGSPGLRMVVVRGINIDVPPVLGNLDPILKSPDMAFLRNTLGKFSEDCIGRVPIYGCSAFEYIQYLDIFLTKMPEGQKYQYVCGRTDVQAAHMAGYTQTEGKCVLMINDIYGINSLGESLRALFGNFDNRQLLIMIWHPTLVRVIDHFHLHRPPMVWPNMGPHIAQYYVRSERDICLFDFQGLATTKVTDAITKGTPLIVVNMLPEHERNFVSLDIRIKAS